MVKRDEEDKEIGVANQSIDEEESSSMLVT